jgi:hypothetical protein
MNARRALTLQTQLTLPLYPLIVDTLARALLLHSKLEWYRIPDLVTLLVTHSLFCLGVMAAVNAPNLPSDDELGLNHELIRQRLLGHFLFFVMIAGAISMLRAVDESNEHLHLMAASGFYLAIFVFISWLISLAIITSRYISYVKA